MLSSQRPTVAFCAALRVFAWRPERDAEHFVVDSRNISWLGCFRQPNLLFRARRVFENSKYPSKNPTVIVMKCNFHCARVAILAALLWFMWVAGVPSMNELRVGLDDQQQREATEPVGLASRVRSSLSIPGAVIRTVRTGRSRRPSVLITASHTVEIRSCSGTRTTGSLYAGAATRGRRRLRMEGSGTRASRVPNVAYSTNACSIPSTVGTVMHLTNVEGVGQILHFASVGPRGLHAAKIREIKNL